MLEALFKKPDMSADPLSTIPLPVDKVLLCQWTDLVVYSNSLMVNVNRLKVTVTFLDNLCS